MSANPDILVLGATGNIGKEVCASLAKRNVGFRAGVHKIDKAESIKKLGNNIDVVEIDVNNPDSLDKALKGITKIFFMTPPGQTTSAGKAITAACKRNGVKHIVKLSALGSEETGGKFIWAEEHTEIENLINKEGIPLTSIRPSSFFSNIFMDSSTIKSQSTVYKASGQTKLNMIDNKDIGECVAVCLTTPNHEGKIYNITGPDTMNFGDLCKILTEEWGRQINFVPINDDQLRDMAKNFLPGPAIEGFSNMWTYFRNGGYDRQYDDAKKLLGRELGHVRPYIRDIKPAFA